MPKGQAQHQPALSESRSCKRKQTGKSAATSASGDARLSQAAWAGAARGRTATDIGDADLRRGSSVAVNPIEKKPFYHFYPGASHSHRELVVQLWLPVVPELGHQQSGAIGSGRIHLAGAVRGIDGAARLPGHVNFIQRADALTRVVARCIPPGAAAWPV